jgi:hypothetical protein
MIPAPNHVLAALIQQKQNRSEQMMNYTGARRSQFSVLGVGVAVVIALAGLLPYATAARQTGPQAVYFSATGHTLDNRHGFLDYWRANGQTARFGLPITATIEEAGRPVQYFERARMEYHADAGRVMLGLLGRELTAGQAFPVGPVAPGRVFPETGYTVFGKFRQYWQQWGGLASFGYPISESFVTTLADGSTRAVQWFERGRLEYVPEAVHPFYRERREANNTHMLALGEMRVGDVGRAVAQQRGYDLAAMAWPDGVPEWSAALWPQRIEIDLSEQRLLAYEGELLVLSGGVSTGADGFETVRGSYNVYGKLLYDDMSGNLQGEEYDVRKVPYVLYFHRGYAIHGTYWHDQFGTGVRRSHGCVNLPLDRAEWLWRWAAPTWDRAKASRYQEQEQPQSRAEADLQPLEGLAVFGTGPQVIVRP